METLKAEGTRHVFGVSGSPTLSILDAIYNEPQIRYIQAQHEQNAMYMANGYARGTRSAGLCLVSPGPGITNCLSAVAQAYYTSTPGILIGIEHDTRSYGLGSSVHHDLDALSIFKPVTKLSLRVERTDRLVGGIQKAFHTALSGRKGPVYLGLAEDVIWGEADTGTVRSHRDRIEFAHPADPLSIAKAVRLLEAAERPVALAGGGVAWSQAQEVLLALAEHLAMPVATTGHNKGLIPEDHPLALGTVSQHGTPPAMQTMREADVLLAVGCTFNNFRTRSFANRILREGVRIIQVDIDPQELGKIYPPEVGLLGDARLVLQDILQQIMSRQGEVRLPAVEHPRIKELTRLKKEWEDAVLPLKRSGKIPIQRFRLMHDLRQALPSDAIVAGASGGTNGWYEHAFKALAYNYAVGGWHPLGAEYPETLGIKVALPDRVVVCLTGDGALMMTIQEIATAAANDIPVLCVVCNNGLYGNMRHTQITQFGSRFIGTQLPASNLSNIAREFGAYGERVVKPDEIIPAISRALASGKPALVEVMIDDSLENLVPPPLSGRSLDKTGAVVDR